MAARTHRQGQIARISIPAAIYPATRSGASVSFRHIHEPSGKRIRYEKVARGIRPVDRGDIVKGYQISQGIYLPLEDDESVAAKVEKILGDAAEPAPPRGSNVIDRMAVLTKSLGNDKKTPAQRAPAKKTPAAKKPAARKRA